MVRVVGTGSVPGASPECLNKVSLSSWVMIWSPRVWWLHKSRSSRSNPFLTAEEHLGGGKRLTVNAREAGKQTCTGPGVPWSHTSDSPDLRPLLPIQGKRVWVSLPSWDESLCFQQLGLSFAESQCSLPTFNLRMTI